MTATEWKALVEEFGGRCVCCLERGKMEADHVVPVSLGGSSALRNIQPLCRSCNARKGATTVDFRPVARLAIHQITIEEIDA